MLLDLEQCPDCADGRALEDDSKEERNCPGGDNGDADVGNAGEGRAGDDVAVEKEDADFGEAEGEEVENLGGVFDLAGRCCEWIGMLER